VAVSAVETEPSSRSRRRGALVNNVRVTDFWTGPDLQRIEASGELEIAVKRPDGTLRRWTPIWVVCADDRVYVRTWYRRDTGWFGNALRSGRARIRVPGLEADVVVEDVGAGPSGLRGSIDDAYRGKYGDAGSTSMVGDQAAATTLRLDPDRQVSAR
jgi:hypothetical protein